MTFEDLQTLELPAEIPGDPGSQHAARAEQYEALARAPHPDDEPLPGDFLVLAGEHRSMAGDAAGALRLFREAGDGETVDGPDPRTFQVRALFELDQPQQAKDLSEDLRRSRPDRTETYLYMGEVWEGRDNRQALGWLTRGAVFADETEAPPADLGMLCLARWRLRQSLGHEPDELDELGLGFAEALGTAGED